MKFLHTADLHIGKKIFEQSLIEDQRFILDEIYRIAAEEQVDAVVIAGDVYDRAVPSTEAVTLLDSFLTRLVEKKIPVLMVSGNHDSPERIAFAGKILERQGLYVAGTFEEPLRTVTLEDEYGPVAFVLLPFVKPAAAGADSSAEAVEKILGKTPVPLNPNSRCVLVTHFFVTGDNGEGPELSDSECDSQVGGLDGVPAGLFQHFSYVALGHIHKPQHMGMGKVYYSGSPLKYSFSEALTEKSVNIVELGDCAPGVPIPVMDIAGETEADGQLRLRAVEAAENPPDEEGNENEYGSFCRGVTVRRVPLKPLRDMRCLRGSLAELMKQETVEANRGQLEDYLQVTLTDTEELIDPMGTLRSIYPNVLQIVLEKNRAGREAEYESRLAGKRKGISELFDDFYELLKGELMDEKRREIVAETVRRIQF